MKKSLSFLLLSVLFSNVGAQDTIVYELLKNINTANNGIYDESSSPRSFLVLNNQLLFIASGDSVGTEIFMTDGSRTGTKVLKDFSPSSGFPPQELTLFGELVVFTADDGNSGFEPWISDGTTAGTKLLKDIRPEYNGSNYSSDPSNFFVHNNKIYFAADEGYGSELYLSDGTEMGTYMLKNIGTAGGHYSSHPSNFVSYGNQLLFSAADSTGYELWKTDGSLNGTKRIKNIKTINSSNPSDLIEYQNKVYFSAHTDSSGRELWVTDGTEAGTLLFKDINIQPNTGSNPVAFKIMNDKLYFIASDSIDGQALWCLDKDSLYMIKYINLQQDDLSYTEMHVFNEHIYFGEEYLWISDGTANGTMPVLSKDSSLIERPEAYVNWNNLLIFIAERQNTNNTQLWQTDGSLKNTKQVFPDSISGWASIRGLQLALFNNEVYFSGGLIDSIGVELYKLKMMNKDSLISIEENLLSKHTLIYPNPTDNILNIKFIQNKIQGYKEIELWDIQGRLLIRKEIRSIHEQINMAEFKAGTYLLKISSDQHKFSTKIIKK